MKEKLKRYVIKPFIAASMVAYVVLICAIAYMLIVSPCRHHNILHSELELKYVESKAQLVDAVQGYIDSIAPNSSLSALAVVEACREYDVDVVFVIAQAQKESHFGTRGLARKTNSVWNIYAYDGYKFHSIHKNGKYHSPNESIEPYLQLLANHYLVGKTEYDLMEKYVNTEGKRYASAPNYEKDLYNIYATIKQTTPIDSLAQRMRKYEILLNM